jgi:MraZ protein
VVNSGPSGRASGKNTVEELVLYGRFRLSIDVKNRVLVPSEIRKRLIPDRDGEAFFIVTGSNGKLWLYPEKVYEKMAQAIPKFLAPNREQLEIVHAFYSLADRIELDKQGRVLLPGDEMKRTGTGSDVMMIGALDHLEIWNVADWESHRENLQARRNEISLLANQNKTSQGT